MRHVLVARLVLRLVELGSLVSTPPTLLPLSGVSVWGRCIGNRLLKLGLADRVKWASGLGRDVDFDLSSFFVFRHRDIINTIKSTSEWLHAFDSCVLEMKQQYVIMTKAGTNHLKKPAHPEAIRDPGHTTKCEV